MAVPPEESKASNEKILEYLKKKTFGPQEIAGRKIAIFSLPGHGKTVLATRLGKQNLIITDEDGYTSLSNHPELNGTWKAINFKSWDIVRLMLPVIESGEFTADNGEPFDNVIFDTMSGMIAEEIQNIVKSGVTTQEGKVSPELAGRPDYFLSEQRLLPVMKMIAQMKRCSVTMLFHVRTGDKLTPGDYTRPETHAAAFRTINKYTSVIAFLEMKGVNKRRLKVMPTDNGVSVKTRHNFGSEFVTDDEFVKEIEKWKGNS